MPIKKLLTSLTKSKSVLFISLFLITISFSFFSVQAKLASGCYASTTNIYTTLNQGGFFRIFSLSSSTNATVSLQQDYTNYPVNIYCQLGNATLTLRNSGTCLSSEIPFFNIATTSHTVADITNTHVESPTLSNYPTVLCVTPDATIVNSFSSAERSGSCLTNETEAFSAPAFFSTTGNSHLGSPGTYTLRKCLTLGRTEALSVTLNSTSTGFGTLSSATTTYATVNGLGTSDSSLSTTTYSFSVAVKVSGNYNYAVTLSGDTLRNQQNTSYTIPKIGATPTSFTPGTAAFGLRVLRDCPDTSCAASPSTVAYPYNQASTFAYDGGISSTTLIANGISDDNPDTFSLFQQDSTYYFKLGAAIDPLTPAGNYKANLVLVVTSQF